MDHTRQARLNRFIGLGSSYYFHNARNDWIGFRLSFSSPQSHLFARPRASKQRIVPAHSAASETGVRIYANQCAAAQAAACSGQ